MTIESGPSTAGRLVTQATRATLRTALQVGCYAAHLPWPFGAVDLAARAVPRAGRHSTVQLSKTTADLIYAHGVGHTGRIILYFHGGAFLTCGINTHERLITRLSKFSNAPVLAVNYRMIPKHSVGDAITDCLEAYDWLRRHYEPEQIVLAGDSAGGYLTLAVANHLATFRLETPAGMAMMSPLLELDPTGKKNHPNIRCDAMFGPEAFDALYRLVSRANGGSVYEPLYDITSGLPPTLIHVSGHEALLHDAYLAQEWLEECGVPVEVTVWPGQIHVFQIASVIPESTTSLRQIGAFVQACTHSSEKVAVEPLTKLMSTVG